MKQLQIKIKKLHFWKQTFKHFFASSPPLFNAAVVSQLEQKNHIQLVK